MGVRAAYVVYGASSADEVSIAGPNRISHYHNGEVRTFDFDPAELGIQRATVHDLLGGNAEENAVIAARHPVRRHSRPQARRCAAKHGLCPQH